MVTGGTAHLGVVASDPLRSLGLVSVLEEMPGVTAAAVDLEAALRGEGFSAVLVHMHSPVEALITAIGKMRKAKPGLKLIVMSEGLLPDEVQAVIGAGAKGFVAEDGQCQRDRDGRGGWCWTGRSGLRARCWRR